MILQWDFFLIALVSDQSTECDKYDIRRKCDGRTIRYQDMHQLALL